MKILVTGARGFVGHNLTAALKELGSHTVFEIDKDSPSRSLAEYTKECDFVFHLAGVNRPRRDREYLRGNRDFTDRLIDALQKARNKAPIVFSSSVQAENDSPYGLSKRAAEQSLLRHAKKTGASVFLYRLPNLFGKWSRPDYNSVVATFCHRIAQGESAVVDDPEKVLSLVYIDDAVTEFVRVLSQETPIEELFCASPETHEITLGALEATITGFHRDRGEHRLPDLSTPFLKKLFATYLSFVPPKSLALPLYRHVDERGTFTEIFYPTGGGQLAVNTAHPGITKGNHYHHTKTEKFLVVEGHGVIRLRRLLGGEVLEYPVCGECPAVIDIPPGFVHHIQNVGTEDLVTLIWASERFDPAHPDTFPEAVLCQS